MVGIKEKTKNLQLFGIIIIFKPSLKEKGSMSKDQSLSLENVYNKNISTFQAVIMAAQEARFINEQANLGFIELNEKPTTIAIHKFKQDRIKVVDENPQEGSEEESLI